MNEERKTKTNEESKEVAENTNATSFGGSKNKRNASNNRLVSLDNKPQNTYIPPAIEEEEEAAEEENDEIKEEEQEKSNDNARSEDAEEVNESNQPKQTSLVQGLANIKGLKFKIIIIATVGFIVLIIFFIYAAISGYTANEINSSNCDTATPDANLITFLDTWEWEKGAPTCNSNEYRGYNIGDGVVSIGPGITNYVISGSDVSAYIKKNGWQNYFNHASNYTDSHPLYRVDIGICVPKDVISNIKLYVLETQFAKSIDASLEKYGVTLTQYQKDALTSFAYNLGNAYNDKLIEAYKNDSYKGLWDVMKDYAKACINGNCGVHASLQKRRKAEFALFVTGDYTDQNKWDNRSLANYDYYDSEDVMSRKYVCGPTSDFVLPLPEGAFGCSSPYGWRIHPLSGTRKFHSGLDLYANQGTSVYASKSGTVTYVYNSANCSTMYKGCHAPSCGNQVTILHEDGSKTSYCHMYYHSVVVKVGQKVSAGETIGKVGSTGSSTGNHLHFMIYDTSGNLTDPWDTIGDYLTELYKNGKLGNFGKCHL